jgi:uncharacterized Tic20 family protein
MSEESSRNTSEIQQAITADDKNLAMFAHLLGIVTGFLGCLIIWLLNKDKPEHDFASRQAKEALNFQITVFIAYLVGTALTLIIIGVVVIAAVWIANLVLCILAGVAASKGEDYRYPLTLRLLQ